jgi:hypothetical protein
VAVAQANTVALCQSPGPPRLRKRPAKETALPSKVPLDTESEWYTAMTTGLAGFSPGPLSPFQAPYDKKMQALQASMCVGECICLLMRHNHPK